MVGDVVHSLTGLNDALRVRIRPLIEVNAGIEIADFKAQKATPGWPVVAPRGKTQDITASAQIVLRIPETHFSMRSKRKNRGDCESTPRAYLRWNK